MEENEILARFGIGKKFAYGLFIQSIFVIISAIFALNTLQWDFFNGVNPFEYIPDILVFLTCISLLIYSFYEYNKNTEYFFIISIILTIVNSLLWFVVDFTYCNTLYGFTIPALIELSTYLIQIILYICFLYAFNKKYSNAKYIIILAVIFEIIGEVIACLYASWPWYGAIPYIVISVSIALTYFERVQRGKYPKLK